jgi:hypothetical protein
MSNVFDAVLCPCEAAKILAHLPSSPKIEIRELEPNISILLTVENIREFSAELASLAPELSVIFGKTLFVQYDDRVGWRYSELFINGESANIFGENEEIWIRLNDDGLPDLDENGKPISELIHIKDMDRFDPDEEWETYRNAIQLGLAAFGAGAWHNLRDVILEY